jgi:NAD kinase
LRLLRVLFFKCVPPTLPKIVTFSSGSLNYLSNFDASEFKEILNATALATTTEQQDYIAVQFRSRLACTVENTIKGEAVGNKKMYINSDGETEYAPSECHALNEITITRGESEFMSRFDIYVNDVFWTIV